MRTACLALLLLVGLAPRALGGEGSGPADGRGASGDGPVFLLANARLLDLPPVSKGSAIVSDAVLQDLPPVSSELKVVANPGVQDLPLVSEKSTVVVDTGPQDLPPVPKEPIVVADARPEELPPVADKPIVVADAGPQDLPAVSREPIVVADAGPQELPPVPDGQFVAEAVDSDPPVAVVEPAVESDPLVWWSDQIRRPQLRRCASLPLSLDQLAIETLRHSHQVRALRMVPEIQETRIVQADAEFDADVFVESYWTDRDEPVGSFLTTGGPPRLLEDTLAENMGWRRKTRTGAEVEVSQQLVMQDSNSNFFIPENQAQSRLAIGLRQPLLRDGGKAYNRSLIVLAKIDTRTAWEGFAEGLQDHLLEVARQYWQLYYQRALVLQKERNLGRALAIREELESREQIDALRSQIARAPGQGGLATGGTDSGPGGGERRGGAAPVAGELAPAEWRDVSGGAAAGRARGGVPADRPLRGQAGGDGEPAGDRQAARADPGGRGSDRHGEEPAPAADCAGVGDLCQRADRELRPGQIVRRPVQRGRAELHHGPGDRGAAGPSGGEGPAEAAEPGDVPAL